MSYEINTGSDIVDRTKEVGGMILAGDTVLVDEVKAEREALAESVGPTEAVSSTQCRDLGATTLRGLPRPTGFRPQTTPKPTHPSTTRSKSLVLASPTIHAAGDVPLAFS